MKNILFRAFAIFIGVVVIMLFSELFLRINQNSRYICSNFFSIDNGDGMVNRLSRETRRYRPSALLGYERIPSCSVDVNSYGLIGKEYELEKYKGTFRILILGDSIAENGASGEFLQDCLNNDPGLDKKYRFQIWNAGVGGYCVRQYSIFLQHKGLSYKPDIALIFLFMNDFYLNTNIYYKDNNNVVAYYFPGEEVCKTYIVNPFFMRHSYLYRFLILKKNALLLNTKKSKGTNFLEENGMYYMRLIKEICVDHHIPLFVAVFPYLKSFSEYSKAQKQEYQATYKVLNELGIDHFNAYGGIADKDLCNLRDKKEDEIHPNLEGHRRVAKVIYGFMSDKFFKNNQSSDDKSY